jgi:hypothetical protein
MGFIFKICETYSRCMTFPRPYSINTTLKCLRKPHKDVYILLMASHINDEWRHSKDGELLVVIYLRSLK